MTVHEVSSSGELKEIHAGTGHSLGGNLVNEGFSEVLLEVFGKKLFETFKREQILDWINLSEEFEEKKRAFHPAKSTHTVIKIPCSLIKLVEEANKVDIAHLINDGKYSSKIKIDGEKMMVDSNLMKSLFEKPVKETIAHVRKIFLEIGPVENIFMVGGFSTSPVLQIAMKAEFPKTDIINREGIAVATGAVIVGPNPHLITQRVLKKTYGLDATTYFVKDVHPESRKSIKDGKEWCHKIFKKQVERGQTVVVGEVQEEEYYNPLHHNQPNIIFSVYASDDKDPKFTDEGCTCIGNVKLDLHNVPGDMDRDIAVNLTFDESEIKVKARVIKTGKEVTGVCNFLG